MGVDTGPEIRGFRAARVLYRTRDGRSVYNGDLTVSAGYATLASLKIAATTFSLYIWCRKTFVGVHTSPR
jgi:hypothetical protein